MCNSVSQTCRAPSDCSTVDATRPYSRGGVRARSDLADTSASVLGRRQTRRREFATRSKSAGDVDRGIALCEATLADARRVLGEDHPITKTVLGDLRRLRSQAKGPAM